MAKKAYIGVDGVARKIKKGYVGVENFAPRVLPSGYTQAAYIESNGAQYIDSGVVGKSGIEVYAKWMYTVIDGGAIAGSLSNKVRFYAAAADSASWGYGYSEYVSGSEKATANTVYSVYSKLYAGEQKLVVDGVTVATGSVANSYDTSANMYIFAINNSGSPLIPASGRLYSMQIYSGGVLVRDYIPCTNASGVAGLYDIVNGTFGGSATSTAFVAGSSAPSVARKIKKAYIGIGGVARPCWSGGELAYYGTITPLTVAKYNLAAATTGNYAVFAGGRVISGGSVKSVEAYNESLVCSFPGSNLMFGRERLAGANIGNCALFAGGANGSTEYAAVEYYDSSLVLSDTSSLLIQARTQLAATSNGSFAWFAGGTSTGGNNGVSEVVDGYNTSLTHTSKTSTNALSVARANLAAASIGDRALFGGGGNSSGRATNNVDVFDTSLTKTVAPVLSSEGKSLAATTVGNHALFGGGCDWSYYVKSAVDAYDASLTRTTLSALRVARQELNATTVGKFAIFGGGIGFDAVDVFDASLTRTTGTPLSFARGHLGAVAIGNYALFGGGQDAGSATANVDAFVVA